MLQIIFLSLFQCKRQTQKCKKRPYSAFGRQANGGGYSTFPLATLLTAPPSDLMQLHNSGVGLGYNWDGDAKAFNVRVANKNYKIRDPYVVFEVEYLRNDWVKKDGVNANIALCDWPNFRYPH